MTSLNGQKIAGAALAACLFLAPAFAQQPPRPAAPVPAVPAAPVPAAPAPSGGSVIPVPNATPAHLAAARDLVVASGMLRSFTVLIPEMMRQLNSTVTRTRPELIADMKGVLDGLEKEFLGYANDLVEPASRVYTAFLTEEECKIATVFFKSPAGVKYVDSQPSVYANVTQMMESWSKQISVRMYDRAREEMKKKGREI